jgi:large repetitive protein
VRHREVGYNTVVDTSTVSDTLKYLGETGSSYSLALQWLNATTASNNDYLTTKIITLANGGMDISAPLNSLLSTQNSDGSWGADVWFESDIKRTTLSLLALKSANYSDQTIINNAILYLVNNQNIDGGFGFYSGDTSNTHITALVSSTLQQFQQTTSIATAVNKATSYIVSQQQLNGSWGSVYETAYAYIALVGVSTDVTILGSAINYLKNTQSTNGSWNQDPYSTASPKNSLDKVYGGGV